MTSSFIDIVTIASYFNSHAHVERDITFVVAVGCFRHFNSHAHVERDAKFGVFKDKDKISTHTLTWSVTLTFDDLEV